MFIKYNKIDITYLNNEIEIYSYNTSFWDINYILWESNKWKTLILIFLFFTFSIRQKYDNWIIEKFLKIDDKNYSNLNSTNKILIKLDLNIWNKNFILTSELNKNEKKINYNLNYNWNIINDKKEIINTLNLDLGLLWKQTVRNYKQNYNVSDFKSLDYKWLLEAFFFVSKYSKLWTNMWLFHPKDIDSNFTEKRDDLTSMWEYVYILYPTISELIEEFKNLAKEKDELESVWKWLNFIKKMYNLVDNDIKNNYTDENSYYKLLNESFELKQNISDNYRILEILKINEKNIEESLNVWILNKNQNEYWSNRLNYIKDEIENTKNNLYDFQNKNKVLNTEINNLLGSINFSGDKNKISLVNEVNDFKASRNKSIKNDLEKIKEDLNNIINPDEIIIQLNEFISENIKHLKSSEIINSISSLEFNKKNFFYPRITWENAFTIHINLLILKFYYIKILKSWLPIYPLIIDDIFSKINDNKENLYTKDCITILNWFSENWIQVIITYWDNNKYINTIKNINYIKPLLSDYK